MPGQAERDRQVIAAYEAWDPQERSVNALAKELGISRQGLYQVLARNGVPVKMARAAHAAPSVAGLLTDELLDRMSQQALRAILDELEEAKAEVRRLQEQLDLVDRRRRGDGSSS